MELDIESASFVVKDDWVSAKQAKSVREEAEGKNVLEVAKFRRSVSSRSSVARAGEGTPCKEC